MLGIAQNAQLAGWTRYGTLVTEYAYFTSSGTWNSPAGLAGDITLLLVAGGGAGGGVNQGSGGGGGGVFYSTAIDALASTAYTVTIGAGGVAGSNVANFGNLQGGQTTISGTGLTYGTLTADGGGRGTGEYSSGTNFGSQGGSGGGGCHPTDYAINNNVGVPGFGSTQSGYNTGLGGAFGNVGGYGAAFTNSTETLYNLAGGGGGGAGGVGGNISSFVRTSSTETITLGSGGLGLNTVPFFGNTSIGDSGFFSSGGAGGGRQFSGVTYANGSVSLGGGGQRRVYTGGETTGNSYPGGENTGGGGGGSTLIGNDANDIRGGNGGSGFVLIKYNVIS